MKKTLLLATSAAAGFLIYTLLKRKQGEGQHLQSGNLAKHKEHHITNVFAKAKKKVTS